MKRSKRYKAAVVTVDQKKTFTVEEAVAQVKQMATAKFNEAVDIAVRLGVDPKKADQAVRGTVALPHGIGKEVRVLVLAKPPKDDEARSAGADHVGFQDYIQKIQQGWADVDVIIATPDSMGEVGKLGKVLGPRGLMPNPKLGTVTFDVARAVREAKAGKVEFRVDKAGNVHAPVGKRSFTPQALAENAMALIEAIVRAKPAAAKGNYLRSLTVSTTMSPGVPLDTQRIANLFKK